MTPAAARWVSLLAATALLACSERGRQRVEDARQRLGEKVRRLEPMVSPGPLAPGHRGVEGLERCEACHRLTGSIPNRRCLDCHEEIADRLSGGIGYHGRDLQGDCSDCHRDHGEALIELDRERVDHERTLFPLRGRHRDVRCESCHERPSKAPGRDVRMDFVGIEHDRCTSCHDDPHGGRFAAEGKRCETCHGLEGWKGDALRFDHDSDTQFALTGGHRGLECDRCHERPTPGAPLAEARFVGLSRACSSCHEDPHGDSFPDRSCDVCHDVRGWKGSLVRFDHQRSDFPLDALHRDLACSSCHETAVFRPTPRRCEVCHEQAARALAGEVRVAGRSFRGPASPHRGLVECAQCHDTADGREGDLARAARCASCHTSRYARLFLDRRALLAAATVEKDSSPEVEAARLVGSHDFPFVVDLLRRAGALSEGGSNEEGGGSR